MRAARVHAFGGPDSVRVEEVPGPTPDPGEVLIRVGAVSVNYVDLIVIAGRYQFKPPLPFTPGKGPAGTVAAVGEGVTAPKPGDRVLAMAEIGGYAEYAVAPADQCYPCRMACLSPTRRPWRWPTTPPGSQCGSAGGSIGVRRCWCSAPPARWATRR
jgi:NADPH:quinone reductase-like Zn-dependent oxidoreductase